MYDGQNVKNLIKKKKNIVFVYYLNDFLFQKEGGLSF